MPAPPSRWRMGPRAVLARLAAVASLPAPHGVLRCRTAGYGRTHKASASVGLVVSGMVVLAASALAQVTAAPEITSGDTYTVQEGTTAVATLTADDQDTPEADLTWSKTGGDDTDAFSLSAGGVLAFSAAKDYENPDDNDGDGVYEVTVQVSDGTNHDATDISVTLENVIELTAITGPATVSFPENTATRAATFTASSDADRDGVEWTLTGDDAANFSIDSPPGALRFDIAKDYENPDDANSDGVYEVTVAASDGTNTDTADISVTLENVIELTAITGPATVSLAENTAGRAATFTASSDDDRAGVEWTLTGDDAAHFSIDSPPGALRFDIAAASPKLFVEPPDFEAPDDTGTDNGYEVTLQARVGTATSATFDVTITVTDADEDGAITLDAARPEVGTALTATLSDPDGVTGGTESWQWDRNDGREGWLEIAGATSASYTPAAADGDRYLRVRATYTDSFGADKTAEAMTAHVVIAHRLSSLSLPGLTGVTGDSRAVYPAFDAATLHYAARCTESVNLTLETAGTGVRVSVGGVQRPTGEAFTVDGLSRDSDIRIVLTGPAGGTTTYTVHCLYRDQFPSLTTVKAAGATDELMMFRANWQDGSQSRSAMVMMDNNGVPRLRKHVDSGVHAYFRVFPDETLPWARYAYIVQADGWSMTVLDKYFDTEADNIRILSPFNNLDGHDQHILPNGYYVLMAYSRDQVDLSFLAEAYPELVDSDGDRPGTDEAVQHSVIQVRKPNGTIVLNWSSWDHMAIEDCITGSLNREYGHINALGVVDGDIIAGFRRCSKILRIDSETGEVVWRAGPSLLSRAQWEAGETLQPDRGPAPLGFVGDPRGGFSGQHGGHMTVDGNLLVYDNATHCGLPPGVAEDAKGLDGCNERTRAVEYAIDTDNDELVFQREFLMPETDPPKTVGGFAGHAEPLDNGDWFISWSNTIQSTPRAPMPNTAMQVAPDTGTAKLTMTMQNIIGTRGRNEPRHARVVTVSPVALAQRVEPLEATVLAGAHTSVAFIGVDDTPTVLVAFNRPVVDFDSSTPSLSVTGATVTGVTPHLVAGDPAHAYLLTLDASGTDTISVELLAGKACGDGGICAADGTQLSEALKHTIPLDRPPEITSGAQLEVDEGVTAVATLRATDLDTSTAVLVWDIPEGAEGGADGDHFMLSASGRLAFGAVKDFEAPDDADGDGTYEVTVRVSDATSSVTADLTVTLTDVDEAPLVSAASGSSELVRFVENDTTEVGTYVADDPEGETVQWRLSGNDRGRFAVTADQGDANIGILRFVTPPDYDAPADHGRDNGYEVTVEAFDPADNTGSLAVTVTVTDVNEAPVVSGDATRTVTEGATRVLARYGAVDPEGEEVQWSLAGRDAAEFTVAGGVLRFGSAPDFKSPTDHDTDNVYMLRVQAGDGDLVGGVDVEVTVSNVEEAGTVVLSSSQPQEDTTLTATLTDPDGVTANTTTWKWERSVDRSSWTEITSATTAAYTPATADVNSYLRVTASYDDGHGTDKTARAVSSSRVRALPVTNSPPAFGSSETGQRTVAENTPPGRPVGAPVAATDPDAGDSLTYELSGTDAFSVDAATGQIRTLAPLDHEQRTSHTFVVVATDPSNASTRQVVTIQVSDVDEAPTVSGDILLRISENHADSLHRYVADDPEGASVTWTLTGPDRDLFAITNNGVVTFNTPPDYDTPTDRGRDNAYDIVVNASDSTNTGSLAVTVTVTDINEAPMVTGDATVDFDEGSTSPVTRFQAADPERETVSWFLTGRNVDDFTVDGGILRFVAAPVHDTADNQNNVYEVTVNASDGDEIGSLDITVTVTKRPARTTSGVGGSSGGGGGGGGGGSSGGGGAGGGVVAPPGASDVFSDVPSGAWYESAVTWMIDNDVTRGCTATMFCPQANLTRQQFVTFLWRAAGQPTPEYTGSQAFSDVEEGVYSDLAIGWAVANNVTRGCTPGTFGDGTWRFCPTQHVTRGEMATLLYRHVEATYVGQPPHHVDVEPDAFYTIPIGWLTDFSVVPGCDLRLWCPNRAATRAEAALFINGIAIRPHLWGPNNTNFTPQ